MRENSFAISNLQLDWIREKRKLLNKCEAFHIVSPGRLSNFYLQLFELKERWKKNTQKYLVF